ncbi:hypothetical protein [Xenorhabdus entomophaga]|uniref:hypothetical protein n=1 Tax=Xenorhabdus entomophaga TaxID=3136257 RepID=UPI0030F4871E
MLFYQDVITHNLTVKPPSQPKNFGLRWFNNAAFEDDPVNYWCPVPVKAVIKSYREKIGYITAFPTPSSGGRRTKSSYSLQLMIKVTVLSRYQNVDKVF